jgi:hypothetical protein
VQHPQVLSVQYLKTIRDEARVADSLTRGGPSVADSLLVPPVSGSRVTNEPLLCRLDFLDAAQRYGHDGDGSLLTLCLASEKPT